MDTNVSQKFADPIYRVEGSAILHNLTFLTTLILDTHRCETLRLIKSYIKYVGEIQNFECWRMCFSK
jgi:hypothetical protein